MRSILTVTFSDKVNPAHIDRIIWFKQDRETPHYAAAIRAIYQSSFFT